MQVMSNLWQIPVVQAHNRGNVVFQKIVDGVVVELYSLLIHLLC